MYAFLLKNTNGEYIFWLWKIFDILTLIELMKIALPKLKNSELLTIRACPIVEIQKRSNKRGFLKARPNKTYPSKRPYDQLILLVVWISRFDVDVQQFVTRPTPCVGGLLDRDLSKIDRERKRTSKYTRKKVEIKKGSIKRAHCFVVMLYKVASTITIISR